RWPVEIERCRPAPTKPYQPVRPRRGHTGRLWHDDSTRRPRATLPHWIKTPAFGRRQRRPKPGGARRTSLTRLETLRPRTSHPPQSRRTLATPQHPSWHLHWQVRLLKPRQHLGATHREQDLGERHPRGVPQHERQEPLSPLADELDTQTFTLDSQPH